MKTIYWSPFYPSEQYPSVQLMYESPDSLFEDLLPRRNKESIRDNWFGCHAFLASVKNTFILRVPFSVAFALDDGLGIVPIGRLEENHKFVDVKEKSVKNAYTFAVRGNWIFWSEEPIVMTTSPAYYHKPVFDGYYVGGSFDIGKWFRPVEGAIQLNETVNTVDLKRNDPIAYVKFDTVEQVELKRFYMTKEIEEIAWGCIKYKHYESRRSLTFMYDKFKKRNLSKVITRLIKENVVN
jgi:hypothetical protein